MRKLASIREIADLLPIEGKDRIELAVVDGWQVIVQKGEYQKGDKTIFCETDSVLPKIKEFEFLEKRGYRIKTMKMGGVLSQGICFPLSILKSKRKHAVGDDVTNELGITQYEPPMSQETQEMINQRRIAKYLSRYTWFRKLFMRNRDKEPFPKFIRKTDEERIQNCPNILNQNTLWTITEKIDGQSGTFFLVKRKKHWWRKQAYEYGVCSRNIRLIRKDNSSYWKVSDKYRIEDVPRANIGDNDYISIQGECIGRNIQKNKYKVDDYDLFVFNYTTSKSGRASTESMAFFCKANGLKSVPMLGININLKGITPLEILEMANGKSKLFDTLREGIVCRSKDGVLSFKAVSPDFLIKHNE